MKKPYKHVFFDLDHTLWDFDTCCSSTLNELFTAYDLPTSLNCSFEAFKKQYLKVNAQMWDKYNKHLISKDEMRKIRFTLVLQHFGLHDHTLSVKLDNDYIENCPKKGILIPGTIDILNYLKPHYSLHILTNGFQQTQETKLKHANIDHFFDAMTTSESCGLTKPNPAFFKYHLQKINALTSECIMIGDNLNTDIRGATASKINSVYFDSEKSNKFLKGKQTHHITSLSQLKDIL